MNQLDDDDDDNNNNNNDKIIIAEIETGGNMEWIILAISENIVFVHISKERLYIQRLDYGDFAERGERDE